ELLHGHRAGLGLQVMMKEPWPWRQHSDGAEAGVMIFLFDFSSLLRLYINF
ncbi:hypothetical protein U9M48_043542, partial [Paspalum notatum var. saurae]